MQMLTLRPSEPALAPFIESLWHFTSDWSHERERILPNGRMQLIVNLEEDELRIYTGPDHGKLVRMRGVAIAGAYTHAFNIDTREQRCAVGVAFRPGGAAPFFREPADALRGAHTELPCLWGRHGEVLRERLLEARTPHERLRRLEAALLERVVRGLEPNECIAWALASLDRGVPVKALTDQLGMTPARFIREFQRVVGLTPKRYARVRRFGRVLEAVEGGRAVDWSRIAASCGYYDQAHMIHEFREFAGMNPTRYRPRARGERNHALLSD